MENLQIYRNTSIDWKPSAVVALATSPDGSQVAAAREDSSLEIWLVSPGSVGWHCQLVSFLSQTSSYFLSFIVSNFNLWFHLIWCRRSRENVIPEWHLWFGAERVWKVGTLDGCYLQIWTGRYLNGIFSLWSRRLLCLYILLLLHLIVGGAFILYGSSKWLESVKIVVDYVN